MSLATRCPACGTTFKVVRDQLRISDGWVRCGRCSNVFDGAEHLHETAPTSDAPGAATPAPAVQSAVDEVVHPDASAAADAGPAPAEPPDAAERAHEAASVAPPADDRSAVPIAAEPAPPPARAATSSDFADIDFFSDTLLRLHVEAPPSGGYAATPLAPSPAITDHIPQPSRTQPVTLEVPSVAWPAFSDYAPGTSPVPVIEFPTPAEPALPEGLLPQAMVRSDANWSHLPSLELGNLKRPAASAPTDGAGWRTPTTPVVTADVAGSAAIATEDAEDAQFRKALRRARIKSAKIAKAKSKVKDVERAAVLRTPSEPLATPADEPPSVMGALRSAAAALLPAPESSPRQTQRPLRGSWRALCAGAALLLIVQWLYQERSAIVARQPGLRPAFVSACEALGCQLPALRQIADITIDGASFARDRSGDGYQLSFTLRNRTATPLAMPAIELALLDTQEQAVVRRVLRPEEFGAPAVLAAHAERSTSLPVGLAAPEGAASPRVAGFRLYPFYP